jgi:hypothetical protein
MNIEVSSNEKLTLISCLNSRLSEYKEMFGELYKMDYADWAENFNNRIVKGRARYIDTVKGLLIKLGDKKKTLLFQSVIDRLAEMKSCKMCFLIGQTDDYYKISFVKADYKVITFDLKGGVTLYGESADDWIQRNKKWIEDEQRKPLGQYLTRKEAWALIKNCKYKGSGLSDKMLRFLKVVLR